VFAISVLGGVVASCGARPPQTNGSPAHAGAPWREIESDAEYVASLDTEHVMKDSVGLRIWFRFDFARLQPERDTTDPGVVRYIRMEAAEYVECATQRVRDSETTLYNQAGEQVARNYWYHGSWQGFDENPMHARYFRVACGILDRLGKLPGSPRGA